MGSIKDDYKNRQGAVPAEKCVSNHWIVQQLRVTDMSVSGWRTSKHQPSMVQFV